MKSKLTSEMMDRISAIADAVRNLHVATPVTIGTRFKTLVRCSDELQREMLRNSEPVMEDHDGQAESFVLWLRRFGIDTSEDVIEETGWKKPQPQRWAKFISNETSIDIGRSAGEAFAQMEPFYDVYRGQPPCPILAKELVRESMIDAGREDEIPNDF